MTDKPDGTRRAPARWVAGAIILMVAIYTGLRWRQERVSGVRPAAESTRVEAGHIPASQWSLPTDSGSMVLVRHHDDRAVALAAVEYWRQEVGPMLLVGVLTNVLAQVPGSLFLINPPHGGCVEIDGPVTWEQSFATNMPGMARHLSGALNTVALAAFVGAGAQSGHVLVYEYGVPVFQCRRPLSGPAEWEGEDWAVARGFHPASGRFDQFSMADANELVRRLEMDLGSAPIPDSVLVLMERNAAP